MLKTIIIFKVFGSAPLGSNEDRRGPIAIVLPNPILIVAAATQLIRECSLAYLSTGRIEAQICLPKDLRRTNKTGEYYHLSMLELNSTGRERSTQRTREEKDGKVGSRFGRVVRELPT